MKNVITKIYRFSIKYLTALWGCFYLLTLGFFFKKNRDLLSELSRYFGYPRSPEKVEKLLPCIHFSVLIPQAVPVRVCEPDYARGNVSLLELLIINQLIASSKPSKIFEFGTFDGRTTLNMAANSPEGALVYTLDLPRESMADTKFDLETPELELIEKDLSGSRFYARKESEKIRQFYGDSAQFDFRPYAGQVDFIFVDASHAYDYVLSDSENALKMLNGKQGLILWHDYGVWNGVTRALNELQSQRAEFIELKHIDGTSLAILVSKPA